MTDRQNENDESIKHRFYTDSKVLYVRPHSPFVLSITVCYKLTIGNNNSLTDQEIILLAFLHSDRDVGYTWATNRLAQK